MAAPARATSLDAYRGFVMLLMLAEVLHLPAVAKQFPESGFLRTVLFHTTHVEWRGCSLHVLIQPSFSFLVGAALAFSIAKRRELGQSLGLASLHAAWRAFALIALGILLRSVGKSQTNFTFEDTLTQIGLGYFPLFLLAWARRGNPSWHALSIALILVAYWGEFVLYEADGAVSRAREFPSWPHHLTGFEEHWEKNDNYASGFDTIFLNLFPRPDGFTHNRGGYCTLSFVPTLATMLLGLMAGGWLKSDRTALREAPVAELARVPTTSRDPRRSEVWRLPLRWRKAVLFALLGAALLFGGWALDAAGVCPMVKRIWTPSWVLFSGGWCFLLLAFFHAATDAVGYRGWSYPLRVIGANSILIYCVAEVPIAAFLIGTVKTHFGPKAFQIFGAEAEPVVAGATVLAIYWVGLWWLYAKRVFVRI